MIEALDINALDLDWPGLLNAVKGAFGHEALDKCNEGRADIDLAATIRAALGPHQHPGF